MAHLSIFDQLKGLFTLFLEAKEGISKLNAKHYYEKKSYANSPVFITYEKWKKMSLTEQYETVFGP